MNKRISYFIILCEILLIFPVYADSSPSPIPSLNPVLNGDCTNTCSSYNSNNGGTQAEITAVCGPSQPGNSPNTPITTSTGVTYASYNECSNQVQQQWSVLGQQCAAYSLLTGAKNGDLGTAIAFTAVAAVCAASCWFPGIATVCTVGDIGATIYDATQASNVLVAGQTFQEAMEGGALGTGILGSALSAGKTLPKLSKVFGKSAAQESKAIAENEAESVAKADAADSNQAVCYAVAALAGLTAAAKWAAYGVNSSKAQSTCNTIAKMNSLGTTVSGGTNSPTPAFTPSLSFAGGGSALGGTTANGGGFSSVAGVPNTGAASLQPSGLSAALSGPLGGLYSNLPTNQIPNDLNTLGTSLGALSSQLQSQPPGATIASKLPNLPEEVKESFKKMDQLAKEGKISMNGVSSAVMTSSGAQGGGTPKTGLFSFLGFGSSAAPPATAQKELSFAKSLPGLELPNGDIWHSNWNGSIFQIVSSKIRKTQERVDQLEWATPLNRALMGLPKEPSKQKREFSSDKMKGILKEQGF